MSSVTQIRKHNWIKLSIFYFEWEKLKHLIRVGFGKPFPNFGSTLLPKIGEKIFLKFLFIIFVNQHTHTHTHAQSKPTQCHINSVTK